MNKKSFNFLLVIGLVVLGILIVGSGKEGKSAAKAEESQKIEEVRPLRNAIEIKTEGEVLHYQRESLWNDEDFSRLLELKQEFKAKEIDSFITALERYNRYVINPKVKLNEARKTTILICDVKGAKEGSWYDFDWFLRPLSLDFIDSHFERREKELYWKGEINGIRTKICIKFPYCISNCHEHVWPM